MKTYSLGNICDILIFEYSLARLPSRDTVFCASEKSNEGKKSYFEKMKLNFSEHLSLSEKHVT